MIDIRLDKLRKEFNKDTVAVKDLDFVFPAGSVTCLLGPSGCGKTTLMRMIAGLENPTRGRIFFGSDDVTDLPTRKRNIGMVFQYPVVFRGISVAENVALPLQDEKLSPAERKKRVDEVLDLLEMRDAANKDLTELDNGTRQKVAVAREVARQPRIILFDEPITNVDITAKLQLKRALKEVFTRLNQTIIYVTHDQTEAMTLADRIALMKDGELIQCDTPRAIYASPTDVFGGWFLGNPGMNFYEGIPVHNGTVESPLFNGRVTLPNAADLNGQVVLGIRPEHVRVSQGTLMGGVKAKVANKSIVTGGQYLLGLNIGGLSVKAKIDGPSGMPIAVGDEVWAACPLDAVVTR
jgi:ABC-type sugar transport system ATPase subunit